MSSLPVAVTVRNASGRTTTASATIDVTTGGFTAPAGAPGGPGNFPSLLDVYGAHRPPRWVPGVDGHVGITPGTVLKPITQLQGNPNLQFETYGVVKLLNSGWVLDGYDFSGWSIMFEGQNITVQNSKNINCSGYGIYGDTRDNGTQWEPQNCKIRCCELGARSSQSLNDIYSVIQAQFSGTGNLIEFCLLEYSAAHLCQIQVSANAKLIFRYNVERECGSGIGAAEDHVNYTQTWGGADSGTVCIEDNLFVHHKQYAAGGQMCQIGGKDSTLVRNTILTLNSVEPGVTPVPTGGMANIFDIGHAGQSYSNIKVMDNYYDPSLSIASGFAPIHLPIPLPAELTWSGNKNLLNGKTLQLDNTEV